MDDQDEILYQSPPLLPQSLCDGFEARPFTPEEIAALDGYQGDFGC